MQSLPLWWLKALLLVVLLEKNKNQNGKGSATDEEKISVTNKAKNSHS